MADHSSEFVITSRASGRRRAYACVPLLLAFLVTSCGGSGNTGSGNGGSGNGGTGGGGSTPPPSTANEWTWMNGSNGDSANNNSDPNYGTLGVAAAANVPGGRNSAAGWTDKSGNLWLFGGEGLDSYSSQVLLNDLWEYNVATGEWTWEGGTNQVIDSNTSPCFLSQDCGVSGVYGILGTPSSGNVPGSRLGSVAWTDFAGNLWLFGGRGLDSAGTYGYLNDLWEFQTVTRQWVWVSGNNSVGTNTGTNGQLGVFGTLGTPSSSNVPPGIVGATGWIDGNNNLWFFGGQGIGTNGAGTGGDGDYFFDNLWKFNPATKEWTWVSGSGGQPAAALGWPVGIYGTLGVPAESNIPGGRTLSTGWIDGGGKFWLFGGNGFGPVGPNGLAGSNVLNDLWQYDPSTNQWTWMAGDAGGVFVPPIGMDPGLAQYGTLGVPAAGNTPGGREGAAGWSDSAGNFWLFGGSGVDANGNGAELNDFWKFNLATKEWTWMAGTSVIDYGTEGGFYGSYGVKGTPSPTNIPGNRDSSTTWVDNDGNFWLFAGGGYVGNVIGGCCVLNDLWRYQP
jgi:N-acetylneuraminic acid mutarotase